MPTLFKLKFKDLTRRVSFAGQPDWQELSNRISDLFCIPQHQVGVTYIDPENEEITLNTREELQDYYLSSRRHYQILDMRLDLKEPSTAGLYKRGTSKYFQSIHRSGDPWF